MAEKCRALKMQTVLASLAMLNETFSVIIAQNVTYPGPKVVELVVTI